MSASKRKATDANATTVFVVTLHLDHYNSGMGSMSESKVVGLFDTLKEAQQAALDRWAEEDRSLDEADVSESMLRVGGAWRSIALNDDAQDKEADDSNRCTPSITIEERTMQSKPKPKKKAKEGPSTCFVVELESEVTWDGEHDTTHKSADCRLVVGRGAASRAGQVVLFRTLTAALWQRGFRRVRCGRPLARAVRRRGSRPGIQRRGVDNHNHRKATHNVFIEKQNKSNKMI